MANYTDQTDGTEDDSDPSSPIEASVLTAQSVLCAVIAGTPVAVAIAASRLFGRKDTGNITELTAAEVKTILGLVKADVGLGSVDNTTDAGKPVSSATQTALNNKQALDATLTALAGWANGVSKIPYTTATDVVASLDFKDEDDMVSDSATALPSQQSTKAYADTKVAISSVADAPIGTYMLLEYTSNTALTNNSTTDGATTLRYLVGSITTGTLSLGAGRRPAGTWKNVSGVSLDANGTYAVGLCVRTV